MTIEEYRKQFAASGGRARAAKMTAEQRSEACRKAVKARWAKAKAKSLPNNLTERIE